MVIGLSGKAGYSKKKKKGGEITVVFTGLRHHLLNNGKKEKSIVE